jgi:hypothetical protein
MPQFDTYTCNECGEEFRALDGANAAEEGYCSPACVEAGKNLA